VKLTSTNFSSTFFFNLVVDNPPRDSPSPPKPPPPIDPPRTPARGLNRGGCDTEEEEDEDEEDIDNEADGDDADEDEDGDVKDSVVSFVLSVAASLTFPGRGLSHSRGADDATTSVCIRDPNPAPGPSPNGFRDGAPNLNPVGGIIDGDGADGGVFPLADKDVDDDEDADDELAEQLTKKLVDLDLFT
jgi:hypothetical protein